MGGGGWVYSRNPLVHCAEGKPPGAAVETRPHWIPLACPGAICESSAGALRAQGGHASLGTDSTTPGHLWIKFVFLGGRLLRIELNQMEDDGVSLGPQAHKPRVLWFSLLMPEPSNLQPRAALNSL